MIKRYEYGGHFSAQAVVEPVEQGETLPWLQTDRLGESVLFYGELGRFDAVYGLGETTGKIDKRGQRFVSYNVDNSHHRPDTISLYASHNFIAIDGEERKLGFFFDTPGKVVFDLGKSDPALLTVRCDEGVTVYAIDGAGVYDITRQFLRAIGRTFLPPRWAFGFGQSRWGYKCEHDIRQVVEGYREARLPLDYVCLDIDYMDRFTDFTVDQKRFPDLPGLVREMKQRGIQLVPIVDAGIKIEPGNPVYDEGLAKGYYCVDENGRPFGVAVWPGLTYLPDFLRPEARAWFGEQYKFYTDQGLEGFWNDMNEPSIFWTEKRKLGGQSDLSSLDFQPGTRVRDYQDFYHQVDGELVQNHRVHNVYGGLMTRASGEGLEKLLDRRYLLFSRSSYIGAHRYGGIWTGDCTSSWDNLRMAVRQMPSLNMCGFLYSGADIGGFMGSTNRELLLRWLAFGVFTPLMRNHTAKGTRFQECYRFQGREDFKNILDLRYRLLPYLYSEFMKAALRYDMFIKPLGFLYPEDGHARRTEDQLMVGDSIMIAPFVEKGRDIRTVYLPEDMTEVEYRRGAFETKPAAKGLHVIQAGLGDVIFFIRPGRLLPVGESCAHTGELDFERLTLLGDGNFYELYLDDGETREIGEEHIVTLTRE